MLNSGTLLDCFQARNTLRSVQMLRKGKERVVDLMIMNSSWEHVILKLIAWETLSSTVATTCFAAQTGALLHKMAMILAGDSCIPLFIDKPAIDRIVENLSLKRGYRDYFACRNL